MSCFPASSPALPRPGRYVRREPEKTVLHRLVREQLETFLATVLEERGRPLPRYVEEELRRYLRCGVLAHGFVRCACRSCGEEIVVGFSCKCRAACPSCAARRMCGTAAHLVDRVFPDVPVRQWVLTAPSDVRRVMALRPDALTAQGRIFVEEIARRQKERARASGVEGSETGAVTFVQRFNSMLGTFVHFHVVALDGTFTRGSGGAAVFHAGPCPSRADIASVAGRAAERMKRWLRRRGLLDERAEEERSNEAVEVTPLEACMQLSLMGGSFVRLSDRGEGHTEDEARLRGAKKSPWAAEALGTNVHAGVTMRAGDREGLERLLRYCARPAFSLERLSELGDGRVAYELRKPRKNGATHLVMTPVQLLGRLAAVVPPPRYPLLRFAGVLGPSSPWRASVVPSAGARADAACGARGRPPESRSQDHGGEPGAKTRKEPRSSAASAAATPASASTVADTARGATGARTSLGAGVTAVYARIDWASLLRRVYLEDVLACPCGGRRAIVADVTARAEIVAYLEARGLPAEAPRVARARSPTLEAA